MENRQLKEFGIRKAEEKSGTTRLRSSQAAPTLNQPERSVSTFNPES